MQKLTPVRLSIFVVALAIIMIVLAMPSENAVADYGKPPNVRFTVINYSQHPFTMNAYGPEDYTFEVAPYSKGIWVVPRGTYSFVMTACNHTSSGSLNLNIYQIMHVPVCGGNAGAKGEKHHNIDASEYVKMVKITIRNKTHQPVRLYLRTLDNHYYLNMEAYEDTTLIVPRDRYVYSFVACNDLQAGYYNARVAIPLDLKCEKK